MVCGWGFYCKASPRCEMSRPSSSCSRETRSGTKAETHAERRCRMRLMFPEFKSMIRKKPAPHLDSGWKPVFPKTSCPSKKTPEPSSTQLNKTLVAGITNRYCGPSFETATEPVIGRAFARPVGDLLRMRSNSLKHNNLMLRSERRERLEAWAASDSQI